MYEVERYLDILKKYLKSCSKLEESMAEGHIVEKNLGLNTEYTCKDFPSTCNSNNNRSLSL